MPNHCTTQAEFQPASYNCLGKPRRGERVGHRLGHREVYFGRICNRNISSSDASLHAAMRNLHNRDSKRGKADTRAARRSLTNQWRQTPDLWLAEAERSQDVVLFPKQLLAVGVLAVVLEGGGVVPHCRRQLCHLKNTVKNNGLSLLAPKNM